MKPKYLNNLIEESYSLFTRMKSGVRKLRIKDKGKEIL